MSYRKATIEEIEQVANVHKYRNSISIEEIVDFVKKHYNDLAKRITLVFEDVYNDQDYDIRASLGNFTVTDLKGNEVRPLWEETEDTDKQDRFYDEFYSFNSIGKGSENGETFTFQIDIETKKLISKIEDLYVKE